MAEIKKISTELQLLDKFLDTGGSAGSSGNVLTSTSTGTSWVSAGTPGAGVYLPLAGGTLTGALAGTSASFTGALSSVGYSGTSGTFSASVTASGNSNNFGNTIIAALTATSGTFSASVTAAGNSNIFGATTVTSNLTTNGVFTIQNAAPYIQWKNVAGTRLSYIQHNATNLVVSADTGQIQLDTAADNDILINPGGTGNVGIGVTGPSEKLHVGGNIEMANNSWIGSTDGSYYQRIRFEDSVPDTSNAFNFETRNGSGAYVNHMTILNNGNVGIGTTSPGYKLEVESGTTPLHLNRTGGATSLIGLDINGTTRGLLGATTTAAFVSYSTAAAPLVTVANTGGVQFNTYGAGTLVTDASGNITVSSGGGAGGPYLPLAGGTMTLSTSPLILPGEESNQFKIAFTGASASSGLSTVDQSGAGLYIGANSRVNNSGAVVYHNSAYPSSGIYFDGWSGDDMEFYTGSSGNPTIRLTIQADGDAIFTGNVGIGTTNPTSGKLVIEGDGGYNSNIGFKQSGAQEHRLFAANNVQYNLIGSSAPSWIWGKFTASGTGLDGVPKMIISTGGNVGIGTASPGTKLDVIGTVRSYVGAGNYGQIENGSFQAVGDHGGTFMLDLDNTGTADLVNIKKSGSSKFYIENGGNVGIGTTSNAAGYKLEVASGDIRASQAVAKISLGQLGSQGDSFFGASGIGSPTVGSQDYGFYSAHNAYRTSTGAWKHSRTSAIGAVRILGGGGGSTGNSGFSFDYSANNGSSDITWTNRMQLFNTGVLKLPAYGAGILQTSSDGTVSSGGDIDIEESVIINDNLVNYKFTALDNVAVQYWLLCFNGGANDVNGTLWGDRSSGHHQAMNLDIVVSAKSASMQTGMLTTKQVLESNEKYTLVTLTYNSNNYIAIKYDGHPYPITNHGYFTGLLKSTIGSDFLLAVNGASVSAVAAFSNANTKATIQAALVGVGTDDPQANLEVATTAATAYGTIRLRGPGGGKIDFRNATYPVGLISSNATGDMTFFTGDGSTASTSSKVTILSAGNVGIGTTLPGAKFEVKGDSSSSNLPIAKVISTGSISYLKFFNSSTGTGSSDGTYIGMNGGTAYLINKEAGNLYLGTGDAINLTLENGGNVGIGTTGPNTQLEIFNNNDEPATLRLSTSSTDGSNVAAIISFENGSDIGGVQGRIENIIDNSEDGSTSFKFYTNNTSTPAMTLFNGGSTTIAGAATATNFILSSDKTLKEKIKDIETKHVDVEWKNFELISEPGVKRSGVVAQELEEKHPEFVRTDKDGLKSVAYIDLLIAKIAELEARLKKAGL